MRGLVLFAAGLVVGTIVVRPSGAQDKPVVRLDPGLDELISPDAQLQNVKDGFGFTEGITWVPRGNSGYVLFSDMWTNQIYKLTPDGRLSLYLDHSGYTGFDIWRVGMPSPAQGPDERKWYLIGSIGLGLDREGRLLIATNTGRSVDRIEKSGKRTTLADSYDGNRLDGSNDLVVKKDGAIYFTASAGNVPGVFMIKDGKVSLAVKDMPAVNGLAFSPDEKYLYVNASVQDFVRRYEVQPDDTITNGQMFFDMRDVKASRGITDGMKVDSRGNVWETGPGPAIWILSPEGKHLGSIRLPEISANLSFGGNDRKTLYIDGKTTIYTINVNTPGIK